MIDVLDFLLMNLLHWRMEICKVIGRTKSGITYLYMCLSARKKFKEEADAG